ncbi:exostosin domain-containing protein [Polynucleobacter asymbioticus]|nr:exostosin family protein [Polynucleobacter asymbioticus]
MIPNTQYLSTPETLNGAQETWFVQNLLLGGLAVSIWDEAGDHSPILSASNIAYLELFGIDSKRIEHIRQLGKKTILIHMGDEFAKKDISAYGQCDLVLRNYFFPDLFSRADLCDRLVWIPNGFKSGVGPRDPHSLQPALKRTHLAAFMGWIHNPDSFARERESFGRMIKSLRKSKENRMTTFSKWMGRKLHPSSERKAFSSATLECDDLYLLSSTGFASGNTVGLYAAIMENSIFAPCPAGNSPETIRLYDALESGCIPISLDHLFLRSEQALGALGPAPFPILKSWEELPEFLSKMKKQLQCEPHAIAELQTQCITWWSAYKKYIAKHIITKIAQIS